MPTKPISHQLIFLLLLCFLIVGLAGCKKDLNEQQAAAPTIEINNNASPKINPFSLRNVQKAMDILAEKDPSKKQALSVNMSKQLQQSVTTQSSTYETYIYFRYNPANITPDELIAMENDNTVTLMDFPFANPAIYENASINENNIDQYKDGKVYGITTSTSPIINTLATSPALQTEFLDTLVLIPESDTELQTLSMQQAAMSVNVCFPTRPRGTVRYQDNQMDLPAIEPRMEPVRGMQVWALLYGIPIITYTDGNGNYTIPRHFSVGTFMGTKAKNARVNIKPFDTHGTLAREFYTLITQFNVGSLHVKGLVSPCNTIDFNFTGHTQVRYWSQLLNAYWFHDIYTAQDGIKNAPNQMVCYAQWGNNQYRTDGSLIDFGNASTLMMGHIGYSALGLELLLNRIFDGNVNPSIDAPNLFNLIKGILPDMTFRVPAGYEPANYNVRLAEIAFHELGHASHYRQVGNAWWLALGEAERTPGVPGNPYGNGTATDAELLSLAESWAQFIGLNHGSRRYINAAIDGTTFLGATRINGSMSFLLENEGYFHGGRWIPYGLYHDFNDAYSAAEPWDNVGGVTIRSMYEAFQPNITLWCQYTNNFIGRNPSTVNAGSVWQIQGRYLNTCGNTVHLSDAVVNRLVQKNDCASGVGTFVPINIPAGTFASLVSVADANALATAEAQRQANAAGTCTVACPTPVIRTILASSTNTTATITYTAPANASTVVIYYKDPASPLTKATYVTPGVPAVITFPARGRTYTVWMAYWSPGCNAITSNQRSFPFPSVTE